MSDETNWETSIPIDAKYQPDDCGKYFEIDSAGNAKRTAGVTGSEYSATVAASLEKMTGAKPGVYRFDFVPQQATPVAPKIDHAAIYAARQFKQPQAAAKVDHSSIYASRRYQ